VDHSFHSHPRVQRDTEAIVNHVFQVISGYDWDVMAAARGLSRPASEAILDRCFDEEISTDVSWPLCLRSLGGCFGLTRIVLGFIMWASSDIPQFGLVVRHHGLNPAQANSQRHDAGTALPGFQAGRSSWFDLPVATRIRKEGSK